jgi:hypothetical protein
MRITCESIGSAHHLSHARTDAIRDCDYFVIPRINGRRHHR